VTPSPDWFGMESAIAKLLPSEGISPDRTLLLEALSRYATVAVREARSMESTIPTPAETAQALCWLRRPIFICGHHRSGTTLLQQLLDWHSQLVVLPSEGTYFSSFHYVARTHPAPREVDRYIGDWIARLVDPNYPPHFKLGRSGPHGCPSVRFARRMLEWQAALLRTPSSLGRLSPLLALVAAYRDTVSLKTAPPYSWVEKTPLNEINVHRFAALPEARFIQMVRHPEATLSSLLGRLRPLGAADQDVFAHAHRIRRSLRLAQAHLRRYQDRYLVVRYEDLTDNPAREMERVRAFLGIALDPILSTPTTAGCAVGSNSSFGRGNPGVILRSRQPLVLSPSELRLIDALTASAARPFGYDIDDVPALTRYAIQIPRLPLAASRRVCGSAYRTMQSVARHLAPERLAAICRSYRARIQVLK
jgi:hypothetical protein